MDRATLAAYDKSAAAFAKDWHEQPAPGDLHDIVARFFIKNGATADIGCGSGREVAWLNANGFLAVGFDASDGLLAEARRRYPHFTFAHAELPELCGIAAGAYDNLLCETVIMHLDRADIAPSVTRSRRPSAGTANDSRSATLSAGRTPSSQVTVRPPASSSQSSEKTRMRSIARFATRNSMWYAVR